MNRLRNLMKSMMHKVRDSPLTVPCYYLLNGYYAVKATTFGHPDISEEDRTNVERNVTFIYKSFNRQEMARRLHRSIRSYYPKANIIIADDSKVPLEVNEAGLLTEIIHLPFNSGLSKGLIAALEHVGTPYLVRLDDDMLLTPRSQIHNVLRFLQNHPEVDLCGMQVNLVMKQNSTVYHDIKMRTPLIIPAGTMIEGREVVYKSANCFVAKTEAVRKVGWDPNIRMIDHHDFFSRAAGQIVSVQDPNAFVYHCHNWFDWRYRPYREDYRGDLAYIHAKQLHARHEASSNTERDAKESSRSNEIVS